MSTTLETQVIDRVDFTPLGKTYPLSAESKQVFLDALIVTGGNVTKAANIVGCSRQNVLRWRNTDTAFAEDFDEALELTTENLEEAAYARALKQSDVLLQFLLKARRPEKYRENIKVETEQINQNPTEIAQAILSELQVLHQERIKALESGTSEE